jgi:hypothetical protein
VISKHYGITGVKSRVLSCNVSSFCYSLHTFMEHWSAHYKTSETSQMHLSSHIPKRPVASHQEDVNLMILSVLKYVKATSHQKNFRIYMEERWSLTNAPEEHFSEYYLWSIKWTFIGLQRGTVDRLIGRDGRLLRGTADATSQQRETFVICTHNDGFDKGWHNTILLCFVKAALGCHVLCCRQCWDPWQGIHAP